MEHVFGSVVSFAVTKTLEYGLDSYYEYKKRENKKMENSIKIYEPNDDEWLLVDIKCN